MWLGTARLHIRVQFALKKLAYKNRTAGFRAETYGVADQHLLEPRGQLRREIANLISMREKHDRWIRFLDQLLQRCKPDRATIPDVAVRLAPLSA